jgi:hypothetical protein
VDVRKRSGEADEAVKKGDRSAFGGFRVRGILWGNEGLFGKRRRALEITMLSL